MLSAKEEKHHSYATLVELGKRVVIDSGGRRGGGAQSLQGVVFKVCSEGI